MDSGRCPVNPRMRANASATFAVPPGYDRLQAIVMPAYESTHLFDCAVEFEVSNDRGEVIFSSGTMTARSLPQRVDVDVRGTSSVTLSLLLGEGGTRGDFGNWNMASFAKSGN